MTLDRIDNSKNYTPSNCKWVTRKAQANNRRSNRLLTFKGVSLNVTQWSARIGVKVNTLYTRLNILGWSIEKALTVPSKGIKLFNRRKI